MSDKEYKSTAQMARFRAINSKLGGETLVVGVFIAHLFATSDMDPAVSKAIDDALDAVERMVL